MRAMKASAAVGRLFRVVKPEAAVERYRGSVAECVHVDSDCGYVVVLDVPCSCGCNKEGMPFAWRELELVEEEAGS